jgi:hypothetical protein
MLRRFAPRTVTGSAAVVAGAALIGVAVLLAGPARAHATVTDPPVWISIQLSDNDGGIYPQGATVTLTATVSNAASFTTTGTDASGSTTTATLSANANPTVVFTLSTSAVSFVSNQGTYTCALNSGLATCSDAVLSSGSSATVPIVLSVIGPPGASANATAQVHGNDGQTPNMASSQATATDVASVTSSNPGAYTNQAPAGCFPTKVGFDQVVTNAPQVFANLQRRLVNGPQTFTFMDGSVAITVSVPAGALPNGTVLSLYSASKACWSSSLSSSSQSFVDGYAVGWVFNGTTSLDASGSLSLSVSDSNVKAGNTIDKTNKGGIASQVGTAAASSWSVSFTDDPGFVLAQAAAAPPTPTPAPTAAPTSSAAATTTVAAPPAGGAPAAQPSSPVPLAIGVLMIVGGTALIGTRRHRRDRNAG